MTSPCHDEGSIIKSDFFFPAQPTANSQQRFQFPKADDHVVPHHVVFPQASLICIEIAPNLDPLPADNAIRNQRLRLQAGPRLIPYLLARVRVKCLGCHRHHNDETALLRIMYSDSTRVPSRRTRGCGEYSSWE